MPAMLPVESGPKLAELGIEGTCERMPAVQSLAS